MARDRRWIRDPSAIPPEKRKVLLQWEPKDPANAELERMFMSIPYGRTNDTLVSGLREFAKVYMSAVAGGQALPVAPAPSPQGQPPTRPQRRTGGIGAAAINQFGGAEPVEK